MGLARPSADGMAWVVDPRGPVSSASSGRLRIATRQSELAMWQASWVAERIGAEIVGVSTAGDRNQDRAIGSLGGRGVFVKEVQQAVLDGRADLAVHSAKDLPALDAPGLVIGAVPPRADPRDALVGATLEGLPTGAPVATGAPRRRAQLAWVRPDLSFHALRGNIATRLAKVPPGGAVVVAVAAMERLGLVDQITEILEPALMTPQGGQGCLAIECKVDDHRSLEAISVLDHGDSKAALAAERAFLAALGAGCDTPAGAFGTVVPGGGIRLEVMVASGDGRVLFRTAGSGREPGEVAQALATEVLSHCGARGLLGPSLEPRPDRGPDRAADGRK